MENNITILLYLFKAHLVSVWRMDLRGGGSRTRKKLFARFAQISKPDRAMEMAIVLAGHSASSVDRMHKTWMALGGEEKRNKR